LPALKVPPLAALAVMTYGLPVTRRSAAPVLASVHAPTVSPFFSPVLLKFGATEVFVLP